MSYTFDEAKKLVGRKIKYYDDVAGWKTTREITETDIGEYLNETYIYELFPMFAVQYPEMFRQTAVFDSWITSFTVDATSTSTTLVATTSTFTNGMVGLTVYNATDDEYRTIESYTSATTVTVDTAIDNDWDGDTVYILGKEFSFGGDTTDILSIESAQVKYQSTSDYRKAEIRKKESLYPVGSEIGTESIPYIYRTAIKTTSGIVPGFGIFPQFTKTQKISNAIEITYIGSPTELSASGDVMTIPMFSAWIAGGVWKSYLHLQRFNEAARWEIMYERAKKADISRFRPELVSRPNKIRIDRKAYFIHRRLK